MIEFDEEIFREVCLKTGHAPIEQNRRFIINHLFIRNYLELASQKEEANKGIAKNIVRELLAYINDINENPIDGGLNVKERIHILMNAKQFLEGESK